jgi:anti-sigma B factor antagonist
VSDESPGSPGEWRTPFSAESRDGALVVAGEIDTATAPAFEAAMADHLLDHGGLVVDLAAVSFMDSTGLSALVEAQRRAEGERIVLRGASPMIRRLLEITGLHDVFELEPPSA